MLVAALSLTVGDQAGAQGALIKTERYTLQTETLASGLASPWSVALLPDGLILITEKAGNLRVVRDGRLLAQPVAGLPPVVMRGQGGLLDVVPHPAYRDNRLIYWSYSAGAGNEVGTEVARGRQDDVQNLGNHLGKVLRLTETGGIPTDNPFVTREGARPEIFTYGNRNVQGAALHPRTGELWAHEHGPQGGDELNILRSGRNYGWPVITHGRTYGLGRPIGEGTERVDIPRALKMWLPRSIGPFGLTFYTGRLFPQWRDSLFMGALASQELVRLTLNGDVVTAEERIGGFGRVRDVREGADGALYVLSESLGTLSRLTPER